MKIGSDATIAFKNAMAILNAPTSSEGGISAFVRLMEVVSILCQLVILKARII